MMKQIHFTMCFMTIWASSYVTIDGYTSGNISKLIFGILLGVIGGLHMRAIADYYGGENE